jgi:hypothetical protein
MFIFLDESGDLGFDFSKQGTTNYFVITLLVIENFHHRKMIEKAVVRTLKHKIHRKKKIRHPQNELKGHQTNFSVKQYFVRQLGASEFQIYTVIVDKRKVSETGRKSVEELYDSLAQFVISQAQLELTSSKIDIVLDKRKNMKQIQEFNATLLNLFESQLLPQKSIYINHLESHTSKGLQAADLFCWGIFQKYERNDTQWYDLFQEKIKVEFVF